MQTLPYGTWPSPITPQSVAAAGTNYNRVQIVDSTIFWDEQRPSEQGRIQICNDASEAGRTGLLPDGFSARSRVHEYGGGAWLAYATTLFFCNDADQRVYRLDTGSRPAALTPDVPDRTLRYADFAYHPANGWLFCVQEDHRVGNEPANTLALLDASGLQPPRTVHAGRDFYATPRLSPNGTQLTWLAWDHPNMPWDGCELWLADLAPDGTLRNPRRLAGGPDEALFQPCWGPNGSLYMVSDRTGWGNLYRVDLANGNLTPLLPTEAECGRPLWTFDAASYGVAADNSLFVAAIDDGIEYCTHLTSERKRVVPLPFVETASLVVSGHTAAFIGTSYLEPDRVIALDLQTHQTRVIAPPHVPDHAEYIVPPQHISFPTTNGATAHAFFYPPHNPGYQGPSGSAPPLIVISHGGPTGAATPGYSSRMLFWTTRGFAVANVNYRGSTGYGRAYQRALDGQWGVADVDDCVAAAHYLAAQGLADSERLIIRGSSAGGYTTLCALAFRDAFRAGASYYGIGDAEALATETHKFESRYCDRLIGPYPAQRDVYLERSPIRYVQQIRCPVILLQGEDDKVVPPAQATAMADALRANGLPVELMLFSGEGHGFRRTETIIAALEAELAFYVRVLQLRSNNEYI